MSNLLDERDKRTVMRKIAKQKYDEMITLSADIPTTEYDVVRLLDEGAVTYADGSIDFYIAKGTLQKYLNGENVYLPNLTDDYIGTINLGHMDFATFPFLLGEWRKEDLHLVDIGNGRTALDVNLRLDPKSFIVKELHRQPYDVGVSAEFRYHMDVEASRTLGVDVFDEVFISDFAIVGECGNVNSSGIELKGGNPVLFDKKKESVENQKDPALEVEETSEESTVECAEDTSVEEPCECKEDECCDKPECECDGECKEEDCKEESVEEDPTQELTDAITSLKEENASLRKEIEELKKSLSATNEINEGFMEKFKSLVADIKKEDEEPEEKHEVVAQRYTSNDGIGEL